MSTRLCLLKNRNIELLKDTHTTKNTYIYYIQNVNPPNVTNKDRRDNENQCG